MEEGNDDEACYTAFSNPLILRKLFYYLDFEGLINCKSVCNSWKSEANYWISLKYWISSGNFETLDQVLQRFITPSTTNSIRLKVSCDWLQHAEAINVFKKYGNCIKSVKFDRGCTWEIIPICGSAFFNRALCMCKRLKHRKDSDHDSKPNHALFRYTVLTEWCPNLVELFIDDSAAATDNGKGIPAYFDLKKPLLALQTIHVNDIACPTVDKPGFISWLILASPKLKRLKLTGRIGSKALEYFSTSGVLPQIKTRLSNLETLFFRTDATSDMVNGFFEMLSSTEWNSLRKVSLSAVFLPTDSKHWEVFLEKIKGSLTHLEVHFSEDHLPGPVSEVERISTIITRVPNLEILKIDGHGLWKIDLAIKDSKSSKLRKLILRQIDDNKMSEMVSLLVERFPNLRYAGFDLSNSRQLRNVPFESKLRATLGILELQQLQTLEVALDYYVKFDDVDWDMLKVLRNYPDLHFSFTKCYDPNKNRILQYAKDNGINNISVIEDTVRIY